MADIHITQGVQPGPKTNAGDRRPRRAWIVWLAVFGGILLLILFKERIESPRETMSQYEFEELVDSGKIVRATVMYDTQNALNEVVGTYSVIRDDQKVEVPFRTWVRLTGKLETKLFSLPQFEPRQRNTVLMGVVWSVLPILIVAVLIWFFFIRQIKIAAKVAPSAADLHARTSEQQNRFDKILDKWEAQAKRMDSVLDKMERGGGE